MKKKPVAVKYYSLTPLAEEAIKQIPLKDWCNVCDDKQFLPLCKSQCEIVYDKLCQKG